MLEGELFEHMPGLVDPAEPKQRTTLNIATNADSLGTWFVAAALNFAKDSSISSISRSTIRITPSNGCGGTGHRGSHRPRKARPGLQANKAGRASLPCDSEPRFHVPIFCPRGHPESDRRCAGPHLEPEGQITKPLAEPDVRRRLASSHALASFDPAFYRSEPLGHGLGHESDRTGARPSAGGPSSRARSRHAAGHCD
jgi:hypothetical protein